MASFALGNCSINLHAVDVEDWISRLSTAQLYKHGRLCVNSSVKTVRPGEAPGGPRVCQQTYRGNFLAAVLRARGWGVVYICSSFRDDAMFYEIKEVPFECFQMCDGVKRD